MRQMKSFVSIERGIIKCTCDRRKKMKCDVEKSTYANEEGFYLPKSITLLCHRRFSVFLFALLPRLDTLSFSLIRVLPQFSLVI